MSRKRTIIDFSLLSFIVTFVVVSLPVSVMGDESLAHYLFSKRNTVTLHAPELCLSASSSCSVQLNDKVSLNLSMPAEVEVTSYFDVKARVTGMDVERMSVVFKGVEHPHGLLPQPMHKVNAHNFQLKGMLSVCGYKKMHWQTFVTVYTERTIYQAVFDFSSIDKNRQAIDVAEVVASL